MFSMQYKKIRNHDGFGVDLSKILLFIIATGPIVERSSPTIEYTLEEKSSSVCMTCTFLDSSDTDCVAVVHQRISQLSYSGLMNITSYKFTRSGDTAYECIEGVNLEDHEVQVLDGQRINQQGMYYV